MTNIIKLGGSQTVKAFDTDRAYRALEFRMKDLKEFFVPQLIQVSDKLYQETSFLKKLLTDNIEIINSVKYAPIIEFLAGIDQIIQNYQRTKNQDDK